MESIGRPTSLRQVKILAALLIGSTGEGIPDPKVHLGQDLYSENHGMGEKIVKKLIDEDQERNGVFKILSHSSIFLNVFRIFNGRFNSNCINYGQIIVQWVELNIKRPSVYTFCEILIFVSKMAAGLIHFGLKISIDVADFQQQVIL